MARTRKSAGQNKTPAPPIGPDAHLTVRRIGTVPALPTRHRDAHKGDFGRVLVIGGSRGMIGAPALAAGAALRSGAGLVTVACPAAIQVAAASLCPCATSVAIPDGRSGLIDPKRLLPSLKSAGLLDARVAPSVIAIGPGLGRGGDAFARDCLGAFSKLDNAVNVPLVLDADVLNALGPIGRRAKQGKRGLRLHNAVLTPHPGEMARLCGLTTADVQAARERVAVETARRLISGSEAMGRQQGVVVLKGAGTVVTDGGRLYVNTSGNPGMSTGGSGDVLTGVIAALIAQGMPRFEAAVLGVYVHGRAGDLAAKVLGETSLIATDLLTYLPRAFVELGSAS